jgi:hypothetical protein
MQFYALVGPMNPLEISSWLIPCDFPVMFADGGELGKLRILRHFTPG